MRLIHSNISLVLTPRPTEATAALDDLLDLMELSNLWDVPDLSDEAAKAIFELRLIRFDNCDDGELLYLEN